jgi:galactokinase
MTTVNLSAILNQKFGEGESRVFRAPARINILGEHVDYLGGLVLPASINFETCVAIRKNNKNVYRIHSVQYSETLEISKLEIQSEKKWANYILGVVSELQKDGFIISGFDMAVDGNIPQGAGLSSSAALEVAVGFALNTLFDLKLKKEYIAVIGQRAENNFVGTQCGIMDQFIIAVGKKEHCISLNTGTLEYSYRSVNLGSGEFYLINSNVRHSLDTSAYNRRREECESALVKIKRKYPNTENLYSVDLPKEELQSLGLTPEEHRRVEHVIGEKVRTMAILNSFDSGNLEEAGKQLYATHNSLSKLFEVSCPETDFIVNSLYSKGVLGARMIGGGFGGCILVLDRKGKFDDIKASLFTGYKQKFGLEAEFYRFQISDGVSEI